MAYDKFVAVDSVTYQFPTAVRTVLAANLENTGTSEGTAVAAAAAATPILPAYGGVAPGTILQFAGATAPTGYLLCQGQSVLVSSYQALNTAIGYQYGGSGLNFNIPDLQNRIPVGKKSDGTGTFGVLNNKGGAEAITLLDTQIPSHTHYVTSTSTGSNHRHWISATVRDDGNGGGSAGNSQLHGLAADAGSYLNYDVQKGAGRYSAYTGSTHYHTYSTTGTNASDGSHTNMMPYIVVNYIIKT